MQRTESQKGEWRRWRPSPSMAVALTALFISITGVTWAATALPKNSVKSKQIKNGKVKSIDVADNGLTGTDIDEASLAGIQNRVNGTCAVGEAIRAIAADGAVTCETDDAGGGGGGPPTGAAGGDLTGTYPNPTIAANAVGGTEVAPNSLLGADIDELTLDSTVLQSRVSSTCAAGQAIRAIAQNGTVTCETDDNTIAPGGAAGGDLAGTYPNPSIAPSAVNSAKVSDNSLTGADVDESTLGFPGAIQAFTGPLGTPLVGTDYGFISGTVDVTTTTAQPRITGATSASLHSTGGTPNARFGLCHDSTPSSAPPPVNFVGTNFQEVDLDGLFRIYAAAASVSLAPGTYRVGTCMALPGGVDDVAANGGSGWVMRTG